MIGRDSTRPRSPRACQRSRLRRSAASSASTEEFISRARQRRRRCRSPLRGASSAAGDSVVGACASASSAPQSAWAVGFIASSPKK